MSSFETRDAAPRSFLISLSAMAVSLCGALAGCGGGSEQDQVSATQSVQEARASVALATGTEVTWLKLADQGVSFEMLVPKIVRYGAGATWVKKQLSGLIACDTATFGSDPAPGVTKTCEVKPATKGRGLAALEWTASTDPVVTGYRVYYGTASGVYSQAAGAGLMANDVAKFTVAGLAPGANYYFAVTAIDATGRESSYSNEAIKTVPASQTF